MGRTNKFLSCLYRERRFMLNQHNFSLTVYNVEEIHGEGQIELKLILTSSLM